MAAPLEPDDELHCPRCRRWHAVAARHAEGTEYTRLMLYWTCRGATYYAGQSGHISRHETRRPGAPNAVTGR